MFTFSVSRIQELFELFSYGDNGKNFQRRDCSDKQFPMKKRDLLEAKVMVDRWGSVVTDWIFHSSRVEEIQNIFTQDITSTSNSSELLESTFLALKAKEPKVDLTTLKNLIEHFETKTATFTIYGAKVHFVDFIDPNEFIGVSLTAGSKCLANNDTSKVANSVVFYNIPDVESEEINS